MKELSKNILFQYFSGVASPLQRKLILEWLQEEGNNELFYCWLEEWEKEHMQFVAASSAGAAGLMEKLHANVTRTTEQPVKPAGFTRFSMLFKVAAAVLLVFSVAWLCCPL